MRELNKHSRTVVGLVVVGVLAWVATRPEFAGKNAEAMGPSKPVDVQGAASAPPAPTLSSNFPNVVPPRPGGLTPEQSRPWFDTFSWQEFIALNWPAQEGQRGVPKNPNDAAFFKTAFAPNAAGDYPQVVWGSWKQAYELFEQGSVRPTPWASFGAVLPCPNPLPTPPKTFLDATPLDINESFSVPLIDQSRNYTRYEIRVNEPEYSLIRGDDSEPKSWLYITPNLLSAEPVTFPISTDTLLGAVEVKAAWKLMTAIDDPKRYYVVNALVLVNPQTKQAQYQKMGLVGFHIAHKTSPFTEWVWSTFEQVDNVTGTKPSYNNGTPQPPTPNGFDVKPSFFSGTFEPSPAPVQVTRVNAIPTTPATFSTVDLNAAFQKLVAGTVWQNYQLIATQWPTNPTQFKVGGTYPGDCGTPFPNDGVANTAIETYDQTPAPGTGNSCMSCHYLTAGTDFSWVLGDRNHSAVTPADQPRFLAVDRYAPNRALDAISKLASPQSVRPGASLRALEALKALRARPAASR
jgi:hypothetical protein